MRMSGSAHNEQGRGCILKQLRTMCAFGVSYSKHVPGVVCSNREGKSEHRPGRVVCVKVPFCAI